MSLEIRDRLKLKRTPGYTVLLNNLGLAHWSRGEKELALTRFVEARKLSEELGLADTLDFVNLLRNLGFVYYDMDDRVKGDECILQCRKDTGAA